MVYNIIHFRRTIVSAAADASSARRLTSYMYCGRLFLANSELNFKIFFILFHYTEAILSCPLFSRLEIDSQRV